MKKNEIYSTVGELRKQLGKYVASESNYYGKTVWIQKLTEIPINYKDTQKTERIDVYGDCVTEITPRPYGIYGSAFGDSIKHYRTNAQQYFRKPTKEEMNIYRNFWRKYRIFGTIPNEPY